MTFMACYSNFSQGVLRNAFYSNQSKEVSLERQDLYFKKYRDYESQSLLPEKTMKSRTKNFFLFSNPTSELMQS